MRTPSTLPNSGAPDRARYTMKGIRCRRASRRIRRARRAFFGILIRTDHLPAVCAALPGVHEADVGHDGGDLRRLTLPRTDPRSPRALRRAAVLALPWVGDLCLLAADRRREQLAGFVDDDGQRLSVSSGSAWQSMGQEISMRPDSA